MLLKSRTSRARPVPPTVRATAISRSWRRAPSTTRNPAPARPRAVASPMPELAPVTTAIRSESGMTLIVGRGHRLAADFTICSFSRTAGILLRRRFPGREARGRHAPAPACACARRGVARRGRLWCGQRNDVGGRRLGFEPGGHGGGAPSSIAHTDGDAIRYPELLLVARPGRHGPAAAAGHDAPGDRPNAALTAFDRRAGVQPLTAPAVMPRTKYRCIARKTTSGSAIETKAAAVNNSYAWPREPTRLATVTVIGATAGSPPR